MTTPVSSSNSSVYDPSTQMSFADGSGPAAPSAGPGASAAPTAPPVVTIDPVVIEGDAGAQRSFSCGEDLAAYFECENP